MIITTFKGGMGNQMFQYAFGRILAEARGYSLQFYDPDNRKHMLVDQFKNAVELKGQEVRDNILQVGPNFQYFDVDRGLQHHGGIFLHGYWQKHYYYENHRDKIRQWFSYDDSSFEKPEPTDLVLHIRLGDMVTLGISVPTEVYAGVLEKIHHDRCIVISDEPESPLLDSLRKMPKVVIRKRGSQMEDFTMIKHAKRVIISQSTYAWWAAFLGNPDQVYALMTPNPNSFWKLNPAVQDVDLISPNGRYTIFRF